MKQRTCLAYTKPWTGFLDPGHGGTQQRYQHVRGKGRRKRFKIHMECEEHSGYILSPKKLIFLNLGHSLSEVSWLQACPFPVIPAGGAAAPLRLKDSILPSLKPKPSLRLCRNLRLLDFSPLQGVKHWEDAQSDGGKKNVYLIRWPLKAPGFCQYKKRQ